MLIEHVAPPRQPLISRAARGRGYGRGCRLWQWQKEGRAARELSGEEVWRRAGLARRQNHDDLAAFEARLLLDLGELRCVALDAIEELVAQLLVGHFPAAKPQCHLDLIAFLEEFSIERIFTL